MDEKATWFKGWKQTPVGKVASISTHMGLKDKLGGCRVRWGIRRMHYTVPAGLYAVGEPDSDSPVLVTANYKLSFDLLRRELSGRSHWLLVLETFGINVWCAAGKRTFGTSELVNRIQKVQLERVVNHRTIILPQLGATGVAAHEVKKATGFRVRYGPVRAGDLPQYLDNGLKATEETRQIRFSLWDRLVLTPVELVTAWKVSLVVLLLIFLLSGLERNGFSSAGALSRGFTPGLTYLGALLMGAVFTPVFLPWIPGRAFSLKGAQVGLLWALLLTLTVGSHWSGASLVALFLIAPALTAYFAMNFTGCSTFTSLSGVEKEMRIAMPVIILSIVSGGAALLMGRFL
ncbi:MAG: mercury methylation corrinoid protein HgcA [Syntrophobacteria bacterium]